MRSRLDELVCKDWLSQFFAPACYAEREPVIAFLYDWQTLIASGVAFLIAIVPAILLYFQNRTQQKSLNAQLAKDAREEDQKRKSALIRVPHALDKIGKYLESCYRAWKERKFELKEQQPEEAVLEIMAAAPYVEPEFFEIFRNFIVLLQVFEERINSPSVADDPEVRKVMIVDIALMSYIKSWLYKYSRGLKKDLPLFYVEPKLIDLYEELQVKFDLTIRGNPEIRNPIFEALNEYFKGYAGDRND